METLLIILGSIFLVCGVLIYNIFSWGFVVYKFWSWFLMPIFPELIEITYLQAIGVIFVISLFKANGQFMKKEYIDETSAYTSLFLSPWLLLILGYVFA